MKSDCHECGRLASFLEQLRIEHPDYYNRPVAAFGADNARLLIVGLAPGKHGANATGRPFTGDHAGILLYQTLHKYGFASASESRSADDALALIDCRITNAVKCLPPQNKVVASEINNCNRYLQQELLAQADNSVIIALGGVAHKAVVKALELKQTAYPFAHAAEHQLPRGMRLIDSYHCSRYNTQTRRLTEAMFQQVFSKAKALLQT